VKFSVLAGLAALTLIHLCGWTPYAQQKDNSPQKYNPAQIRLGARLFNDDRFSSPNGDLPASCSHCHMLDEDPQGTRAYVDFFARSWVSWRSKDPRRDGLRNAPTILDAADMPQLHYDGEFASLEDLVKGTLSGRPLGWLPGEEEEAFQRAHRVLLSDAGEGRKAEGAYRDQFKKAYGVDIEKISRNEAISLVAKSISDYVRTLKTRRDSPYDKFIQVNGLESSPAEGESAAAFADRLLARISTLEARGQLKLSGGFSPSALVGLKVFFRAKGEGAVGNCVSCHAPPNFTDSSFHNIGVSQTEYDSIHGDGSFAALSIPSAAQAHRPSAQFRETPLPNKPDRVDLGHWNFVSLANSRLRRPGESDDRFLERMIATFKTPTLRNLGYSQPYMHNGALPSLEIVMSELMRLGTAARAGLVKGADEELSGIRISEADLPPLVDFLNSLNENLKQGHRPLD
jgi:cytochrome c peroxidase